MEVGVRGEIAKDENPLRFLYYPNVRNRAARCLSLWRRMTDGTMLISLFQLNDRPSALQNSEYRH